MAKKKMVDFTSVPKTLDDHPFYGMTLDDDQRKLRDAIWDEDKRIIFVEGCAGTGKTTVSVATAVLMCRYGLYDNIVYVVNPSGDAQGFLPGTISEKSSVWFEALYQALIASNEVPDMAIVSDSMTAVKNDTAFVKPLTTSYLRGTNIGADKKTILILDETQNFSIMQLRKTLTRACENTKVIVVGHRGQIDIDPRASGFGICMEHFKSKNDPRVDFIRLTNNHRGWISTTADETWSC